MSRNVVLVCGGRDFKDYSTVARVLSDIHAAKPIDVIVHGGANGADSCAHYWAQSNDVPRAAFPAQWKEYGSSAGPRRNVEMLTAMKPNLVVAFPGGKGTAHMVKIARAANIEVREILQPRGDT